MFTRGSRYRFVAQSPAFDARGNRSVGKELRQIPSTSGQFLHTVSDQDRLDLLAFKYYGDPTKWWQICDANPEFPVPLDLLDRSPIVEERLGLVDTGNATRFGDLIAALQAMATVRAESNSFLGADITVTFNPANVRQQIVAAASQRGFHVLRSFAWTVAGGIAEAFTLEDVGLKTRWRATLNALRALPGVTELQSWFVEGMLHVVYNGAMVHRADILNTISQQSFAVSPTLSQVVERTGAKIIVPPDGDGAA
jgi:hypothetical protein